MANVDETCREEFQAVRVPGRPGGRSVAMFIDGEPVVDLWGGYFRRHLHPTLEALCVSAMSAADLRGMNGPSAITQ
jgi:hypothetical protein